MALDNLSKDIEQLKSQGNGVSKLKIKLIFENVEELFNDSIESLLEEPESNSEYEMIQIKSYLLKISLLINYFSEEQKMLVEKILFLSMTIKGLNEEAKVLLAQVYLSLENKPDDDIYTKAAS